MSKSKITPLLDTIFQNKGGDPDMWQAVMRTIKDRTDE